jgi:galactokinase
VKESVAQLRLTFERVFGKKPLLYRAPGRVNLIGEHTDYNEGYVMPAAIDLYCYAAVAPRADRQLVLRSREFAESDTVNLDSPPASKRNLWSDYVVGTALALEQGGHHLRGADIFFEGEVPLGSGLSSSAAIEVVTGYALLDIAGIPVDPVKLAVACRRGENEFVGARVGIMDPFISANGEAGHSLMLDCRSLAFELLPIPEDVRLVVCNTGVKHEIAGGEYNKRRAQCEEGVRLLKKELGSIHSLRDVSAAELDLHRSALPDVIYQRCHHVVTENERVQAASTALKNGDLPAFGRLMSESHNSLRFDYEVSSTELDLMVEIAVKQPGVIGARMTGGGFGGCTINLVRADAAVAFRNAVAPEYTRRTGINPEIYILSAANGVHPVSLQGLGAGTSED